MNQKAGEMSVEAVFSKSTEKIVMMLTETHKR